MTSTGPPLLPARLNPFRSECLHRIPFLPHPSAENAVFATLEQHGWTGGIAGPQGSGKTTLLIRLQDMMDAKGIATEFFQCQEDRPSLSSMDWKRLKEAPANAVIILDGAEQLTRMQWRRFRLTCRGKGGLLVSSHHPLANIPPAYLTDPSPQRLSELIQHLTPERPESIDAEALYHRHNGNLREALRELYDLCAGKIRT